MWKEGKKVDEEMKKRREGRKWVQTKYENIEKRKSSGRYCRRNCKGERGEKVIYDEIKKSQEEARKEKEKKVDEETEKER